MKSEYPIKEKILNGTRWSFIGGLFGQGTTFLVGIVLARILGPEEYGLIGIVTIFTSIFQGIVDSGFSSALIRQKDCTEKDYCTAFYSNIAFAFISYCLLFVAAPLISSFFNNQILTKLIRVMSLCLFLDAFTLVQSTIIVKIMDFKTKASITMISSVISGFIGISMAFGGFGVWALVGQFLSKQLITLISYWLTHLWTPQLIFDKKSFGYLWSFGWKLSLSGIIDRISNELCNFVVGKCYSPSTLGQYTRSNQFAGFFAIGLTGIVQQVSYPALSEIQDDREQLKSVYRKIIKTTMYICAPSMFFIAAVSEPLILSLVGEKWIDAVTYLPLICFTVFLYPVHAINLNMLQVQGRSDLFLKLEIIKKVICVPVLLLGAFWGIVPMLVASIVASIVCYFLNSYWSGKLIGYSTWDQICDIAPSIMLASLLSMSVFFLKNLSISVWYILLIQGFVGILVLLFLSLLFCRDELICVKRLICNRR